MHKVNHLLSKKQKRQRRVRGKMIGDLKKPRLSFFRSNKTLYVQVINDFEGETIMGLSDKVVVNDGKNKLTKTQKAEKSAQVMVDLLKKKEINALVVDRGCYKYHGRIKIFVETLRKNGVKV